jgi:hypothetical protein
MIVWFKVNKSLRHNLQVKLKCGKIKWTQSRSNKRKNLRNSKRNLIKIKKIKKPLSPKNSLKR